MIAHKRTLPSLLLVIALLAAGCSGPVRSSGGEPCPAIIAPPIQAALVSPAPGATGVSTSIGTISFTVQSAVLQGPTAFVEVYNTNTGPSTSLPTGPVTTANGISSVSVPTLAAQTNYTVRVIAPGPCGGTAAYVGTFTTQ